MACLHLSKHFLLRFSMKSHWIINKSKSKTHSTLGQKISPSTETVSRGANKSTIQPEKVNEKINGSTQWILSSTFMLHWGIYTVSILNFPPRKLEP